MGKSPQALEQGCLDENPGPPLAICVTLRKLLSLSETQVVPLKNGGNG